MIITWKIIVGVCIVCAVGTSHSSMAQNRVVTQHTAGTVVEGEVTMLVTQETTTRYRRTTSQGVPEAKLGYTPGVTPEYLAIPLLETVMTRYPDYRMAYWKDYTYVQGYMFEAMDRLGQLTGDSRYLEYIKKYMDHFVDEEGNYKGGGLTNLDNFMTGSAFCTLYGRTGDEKYKKAALQILKAVDHYPSSDGQFWHGNRSPNMWVDGVFMMQMFLIRCAQYVGEADYCYDVACRNIITAARHLQRPDGLILHAWTTEPEKAVWADKTTGLSPEVWSEGMGWYTLVVPNPLNFVDPSGTAMFVYSIQRGVELGLLKAKEYTPVAYRGYQSLFPFIQVNDRGLLDVIGACDGVVIKKNFVEYVTVPKILNAKEAVAGILWAAIIMETEQLKK